MLITKNDLVIDDAKLIIFSLAHGPSMDVFHSPFSQFNLYITQLSFTVSP